jgi:hypothetical protein
MSTLKTINVIHPSSSTTNIVNDASGNVSVGNNLTVAGTSTLTGALTVGGVAAVAVAPGTAGNILTSNGTVWASSTPALPTATAVGQIPFSTNGSTYAATQKIVQGTSQASTSGTSIDFTSIPSWVKRITVMFNAVSTNGTSPFIIQIGSGSVTTTGYIGGATTTIAASVTHAAFTTGMALMNTVGNATFLYSGVATITNISGNTWAYCAQLGSDNTSFGSGAGSSPALGGVLDRIRITTVAGTATFDAGSINILYE